MIKNNMNAVQETALAVNDQDVLLAPMDAADQLMALMGDTSGMFYTSLTVTNDRESRAKIYNMISTSDLMLADIVNEPFEFKDVIIFPVNITSEATGEVIEMLRCVLIKEDGTAYAAVSAGITNSLQKLFAIVGKPPYDPPLRVKVVSKKTRNNFKTNILEIV